MDTNGTGVSALAGNGSGSTKIVGGGRSSIDAAKVVGGGRTLSTSRDATSPRGIVFDTDFMSRFGDGLASLSLDKPGPTSTSSPAEKSKLVDSDTSRLMKHFQEDGGGTFSISASYPSAGAPNYSGRASYPPWQASSAAGPALTDAEQRAREAYERQQANFQQLLARQQQQQDAGRAGPQKQPSSSPEQQTQHSEAAYGQPLQQQPQGGYQSHGLGSPGSQSAYPHAQQQQQQGSPQANHQQPNQQQSPQPQHPQPQYTQPGYGQPQNQAQPYPQSTSPPYGQSSSPSSQGGQGYQQSNSSSYQQSQGYGGYPQYPGPSYPYHYQSQYGGYPPYGGYGQQYPGHQQYPPYPPYYSGQQGAPQRSGYNPSQTQSSLPRSPQKSAQRPQQPQQQQKKVQQQQQQKTSPQQPKQSSPQHPTQQPHKKDVAPSHMSLAQAAGQSKKMSLSEFYSMVGTPQADDDEVPNRILWVGNIGTDVSEQELMNEFGPHGKIESIRILHDRFCAFVNFENEESAKSARKALQGTVIGSQYVIINYRKQQQDGQQQQQPAHQQHQSSGGGANGGPNSTTSSGNSSSLSAPDGDGAGGELVTAETAIALNPATRSLWIGNIDESVTEADLQREFEPYGPIENVRLLRHKTCAFVNFIHDADAATALHAMQGKRIGDLAIKINYGKPPTKKLTAKDDGPSGTQFSSGYMGPPPPMFPGPLPNLPQNMCDICRQRLKDSVLSPCGHMCCDDCASKLMATPLIGSDKGPKCPFCREIITNVSGLKYSQPTFTVPPFRHDYPHTQNYDHQNYPNYPPSGHQQ